MSFVHTRRLYERGARAHFGRPYDPAGVTEIATLRVIPQRAPGIWVSDPVIRSDIGAAQEIYVRLRLASSAPALAGPGGVGDPTELVPAIEISDSDDAHSFTLAQVFLGTLFVTESTGADPVIPRGSDPSFFFGLNTNGWYDDFLEEVEWFIPFGYLLDLYPSGPDLSIFSFVHVSGVKP